MAALETTQDPAELLEAGSRAIKQDDRHDLAHDYYVRAVTLARASDQKQILARALLELSQNLLWHEPPDADSFDLDAMRQETLELYEQCGDQRGVARALVALDRYEESLELCQSIDDREGIARALMRLCNRAAIGSQARRTNRLRDEALAIARALGNSEFLADTLQSAGINTVNDDTHRVALLIESADLYRSLGHRPLLARTLTMAAISASEENPSLSQSCFTESRQIWHDLAAADSEAICLDWLADLAEQRGDAEQAVALRQESARLSPKPPDHEEKLAEFGQALSRFCEAMKAPDEE